MHMRQVTIMIRDMEKSLAFYESVIGLAVVRRIKEGPGEVVFLSNGENEAMIELVGMPKAQKFEGKGLVICFETERLDEIHEIVEKKGLSPSDIRSPDAQSRYFYVYDPDGVSVMLRQKF